VTLNLDGLRSLAPHDYVSLLIDRPETPVIPDGVATLDGLRDALDKRRDTALRRARDLRARGVSDAEATYPVARVIPAQHAIERSTMALREVLAASYWTNLAPLHAGGKIAIALIGDLLDLVDAATQQAIRWEVPHGVPIWVEDIRDMGVGAFVEHGHMERMPPEGATR
jgi:hypothetical protein